MAAAVKKAVLENGSVKLTFPFSWDTVEFVKTLPGRKFEPVRKYWTVPANRYILERLKEAGFELDPKLESLTANEQPKLKKRLFSFQEAGVRFLEAEGGRALLADEMGLGKTIQALAWLNAHRETFAVVVCPAHLKSNWAREIQETLTGVTAEILSGTQPRKPSADIIVINYDVLQYWVETLRSIKPKALIIDEAHYIKNTAAKRTKAVKALARGVPHVIALTGTPVVNRPIEAFNAIRIIAPKLFPNFWEFAHRYCNARHNGFGWDFRGSSNEDELHNKLTSTIMLRRTKDEVLKDLPAKLQTVVPVEIQNREEYTAEEASIIDTEQNSAMILGKLEKLRQLAALGKLPDVEAWIADFLDSGSGKLVVFAVHREVINRLRKRFPSSVKVDGSTSMKERDEAVRRFQSDPNVRLFIGNIQAAGTGLTLTAAQTVAFAELPWTPGELTQAEDRCHRIGQTGCVNVYYFVATGTIDEDIFRLLSRKQEVVTSICDGQGESSLKELLAAIRGRK